MYKAVHFFLAVISVTALAASSNQTIIHNGKIFTSNKDNLWAQALIIQGNTIIAVGDNDEILAKAKKDTLIIDLEGRLVIPGFNDAHAHPPILPPGVRLNPDFDPFATQISLQELGERIQVKTAQHAPGTWIYVTVGGTVMDDPNADRFYLDQIAPDHPVKFESWAGHGMVINTAAMEVLGIGAEEPDPLGGSYERVAGTQKINGRVHEYAEHQIRRSLKALTTADDARASYRAYAETVARFGVTTVQDIPLGLEKATSDAILRDSDLPVRWRSICFPLTPEESCASELPFHQDEMVYSSGIKWILDGSPIERYAFLQDPYSDLPSWSGVFNFPNTMADILDLATGNKFRNQLILHAVGDGAVDNMLNELAGVPDAAKWPSRRVRIEHGDVILPEHLGLMRDLGVTLVQNPFHFGLPGTLTERFGAERMQVIQPMRSVLDAGIVLAFGSDGVDAPGHPFLELLFAVTHPTNPSEAITLEEALIAYTWGSAYAEFSDHVKGTLEKGKLADLAVISEDIFTMDYSLPNIGQISGVHSVLTMVDGRIVHDEGALTGTTNP